MFQAQIKEIDDKTHLYSFKVDGNVLSMDEAIHLLDSDDDFALFLNQSLAKSKFDHFCLECMPYSIELVSADFQFALIQEPALQNREADFKAFEAHFEGEKELTAVFENLSGDALLIAPCPTADKKGFQDLATFCRNAEQDQILDFWKTVAVEVDAQLNNLPIYLNTAGQAIAWLHMRIDDRPKYYQYKPFAELIKAK